MAITGMNTEAATVATQALADATANLSTAFNKLCSFLQARFGCWGDDQTGKSFAQNYVPNYQEFVSQVKDMMSQLEQDAAQLVQLPQEFEEADQENAQNTRSVDS